MAAKLTFATSEEFKKKIVEEFITTLPYTAPCQVVGCTFPHQDVCQLQLLTQQGMKVYSIWRDIITKCAECCEGVVGKYPTKQIN